MYLIVTILHVVVPLSAPVYHLVEVPVVLFAHYPDMTVPCRFCGGPASHETVHPHVPHAHTALGHDF